jgi:hypothetical protein
LITCCSVGGTTYCGQDAEHGWDASNPESARFTVNTDVGTQPMMEDNVTGLVWQGCAAGLSGGGCGTGTEDTYDNPGAVDYCKSLSWGGETDWRLPDRYELASIVDYGISASGKTYDDFPTQPNGDYWTTTVVTPAGTEAWTVSFTNGGTGTFALDDDTKYVRCVRGAITPWPAVRFTDENGGALDPGDTMVLDNVTGLLWMRDVGTAATWGGVVNDCDDSTFGGYTDWRAPNINESDSLFNFRLATPLDGTVFDGATYYVWTGTHGNAVSIGFFNTPSSGDRSWNGKSANNRPRCVRDP